MKRTLLLLSLSLFFVLPNYGQNMEAKKYDNPEFMTVTFIKFHPGKMNRAKEIISTYFEPASEKSETDFPVVVMEMRSGEWDMMVCWKMNPSDMEWEITPDNAKWMSSLMEIAGGQEEAMKIWGEYSDLIARSTTDIGMVASN